MQTQSRELQILMDAGAIEDRQSIAYWKEHLAAQKEVQKKPAQGNVIETLLKVLLTRSVSAPQAKTRARQPRQQVIVIKQEQPRKRKAARKPCAPIIDAEQWPSRQFGDASQLFADPEWVR